MWDDIVFLLARWIGFTYKTSFWLRMVFIRSQNEVGARSAQVLLKTCTDANCRKPARTVNPSARIVVYARTVNLSAHKRRS